MEERRLIGVGVGPGDPELLTCKAVRVLREADVVLVPAPVPADAGPGRAELAVRAHLTGDATIRRVEVEGGEAGATPGDREADWERAAQVSREAFAQGARTVAYATLGDPSVYSMFAHLARSVAESTDVSVEIVPGITAMQALAAASRTPLVEGTESLTLVPATAGLATFTDALEHSDTVVAYKGGRFLSAMHGELTRRGRLAGAVLGKHVGHDDETITPLASLAPGGRGDDLTTVIVPAARA